jgi:hypothetical protein
LVGTYGDLQPAGIALDGLSRAFRKHVEEVHRTSIADDDGRKLTMGFAPKK